MLRHHVLAGVRLWFVGAAVALVACPSVAGAAAGDLDPTFSDDGLVTTPFPKRTSYEHAEAVTVQADGRLVVVGPDGGASVVARYMPGGTLDSSFGDNGIVGLSHRARDVAIQANGKIVLAGNPRFSGSFLLTRLDADGTIDASFGSDGSVETELGLMGTASSVAIQEDGRIVAAGRARTMAGRNSRFVVARYRPNGSPDRSFARNGVTRTGFGGRDRAFGVGIAPGGKIVAVGDTKRGKRRVQVAVVRYRRNGRRDRTFAGNGKLTTRFGRKRVSQGFDAEVLPNGKIIVAGQGGATLQASKFGLVRYRSNGRLDRRFSGNGMLLTGFGRPSSARGLERQPDGKIVVVGYAKNGDGSERRVVLARYRTNGSLDRTFSSDGRVSTVIGRNSWSNGVAIQEDGKIVAAGGALMGSDYYPDIAVMRYDEGGALDPAFSGDGVAITDIGTHAAHLAAIAIQPDSHIVAVGRNTGRDDWGNLAAARYRPDGALDPTFADGGKLTTDFGLRDASASAVAIQPDGKIVVAGSSGGDFLVARLNSDGSPDQSFSGDGVVTTDLEGDTDLAGAVAILPDGKVVVGGVARREICDSDGECLEISAAGLARYTADGSLDPTFAGNGTHVERSVCAGLPGMAIEPDGEILTGTARCVTRYGADGSLDATAGLPGSPFAFIHDIALAPDGGVVTAGSGGKTFVVTRHHSDLSLDAAFSEDGIAVTGFPDGEARADAVAVQANGQAIASGVFDGVRMDFAAARYQADGSLDPAFGENGRVTVDFGSAERSRALAIQPDGKIVLAGTSGNRFALARLEGD